MKLYTANVVADWLALTPRRVRQLRDEGVIHEAAPGLYDMKPTVARYIMYLRKGSKADFNDERALLTRAKRQAADMENEARRGNLHRTEDIEKGLSTMCLNIRGRLGGLPAKLSGELAQMGGDQAGIFDKLKAAINEALEDLANYDVALALNGDPDEARQSPSGGERTSGEVNETRALDRDERYGACEDEGGGEDEEAEREDSL